MQSQLYINGRNIDWHLLDAFEPGNLFEQSTKEFLQSWMQQKSHYDIHTSGSTGTPKKITISRRQMEASAQFTINALKIPKNAKALVCLDTAYIAGKMMLVRAMIGGMDIYALDPSSNPYTNITFQPDFAALVPLQVENSLNDAHTRNLLNLTQYIIIGGAPVSETLHEKIRSLQPNIYATYGMTETVSHIALKKLNNPGQSEYFKAFDEVELGLDYRGCLSIKSILSNHELLQTNDLVKLHGKHEFEWLGRIDNTINTGGVKVQSEKIERYVGKAFQHFNLKNRFFIYGVDDDRLGQKVSLLIEGNTGLESEIISYLTQHLHKYEMPREVKHVIAFKETPTGKIDRRGTVETCT